MKRRHAVSHASYAYVIALCRLRLVVHGDALPREDEPIDLMMLMVIR